jgi:predicted amidohydrolase YtcJ
VCAGSDAPITEPDWRQGVAGMPLRESKAGGRVSGPEQRVELTEALRAYTIHPARQDFAEEGKAPVEVGRVADLCVPDRPPADLDPHVITEVGVDMTVFDGGVVFER